MAKVILSCDQNPEYYFYLPLTSYVWNKFQFKSKTFVIGQSNLSKIVQNTCLKYTNSQVVKLKSIDGYRDATLSQFCRLYGAVGQQQDEYIIVGDIDMIPLNSYLCRDFDKRNLYGYDLTDYTQFPMCYIGMYAKYWRHFLNYSVYEDIYRDLKTLDFKAKSNDFYEYWDTDQYFLTKKIKQYGINKFNIINRGKQKNGYAYKRVDRGNWQWNKNVEYIDSHMLRNPYSEENFNKTIQLVQHVCKEKLDWMRQYRNNFIKEIK